MKKAILAFAVLTVLTSPSFAQSVGEKTGVNSALGIAPKTEDFVKEAAMSDMLEIEAAKVAQQKGNADEKKLQKLKDAKPEDFAGEYDPMQVSAHKDAVSLFERYAKGGGDSKLKDWAGKTLPTLQHHLG